MWKGSQIIDKEVFLKGGPQHYYTPSKMSSRRKVHGHNKKKLYMRTYICTMCDYACKYKKVYLVLSVPEEKLF